MREIAVEALLSKLGAYPTSESTVGLADFVSLVVNEELHWPGPGLAVAVGDTHLGWTLMAETMSGYAGITTGIAGRVAREHDWVTHSENVNAHTRFRGFNIDDHEGPGPDGQYTSHDAVFALAERLTGIEISEELLDTIELTVAVIPEPPSDNYEFDLKNAGWDARRVSP